MSLHEWSLLFAGLSLGLAIGSLVVLTVAHRR